MKVYIVSKESEFAVLNISHPHDDPTAFKFSDIQAGEVIDDEFVSFLTFAQEQFIDYNGVKEAKRPLSDITFVRLYPAISEKTMHTFFGKYLTAHYKVHKIRVLIDGGEVSYYMPIIPRLSGIFNEEKSEIERYPISKGISKIVKYYFNDSAIDNNVQLFGLTELNGRILLHSSSPVHSSLFWHIQKEKYTGMKLHEIYRTKGEPDYDIEATLKAWEQNPNLIDPIYVKQSFMEKWF